MAQSLPSSPSRQANAPENRQISLRPSGRGRGRGLRPGDSVQPLSPDGRQLPARPRTAGRPGLIPLSLVVQGPEGRALITASQKRKPAAETIPAAVSPVAETPPSSQLKQDQLKQKLYQAVSAEIPEDPHSEARASLTACHGQLVDALLSEPVAAADCELGRVLALSCLDARLLDDNDLQQIKRVREHFSLSTDWRWGLSAKLTGIFRRLGSDKLQAAKDIAALYRSWRPVLAEALLHQLADAFRRCVHDVLAECERLAMDDPKKVIGCLTTHVVPYLELLHYGLSEAERKRQSTSVGSRLAAILAESLEDRPAASLAGESRVIWDSVIRFCVAKGGLSVDRGQSLERLIASKAAREPAIVKAQLWLDDDKNRRALRAELACVSLRIAQKGLQAEVIEELRDVCSRLGNLHDMPWIIGQDNACVLTALKAQIFLNCVQRQWQRAYRQRRAPVSWQRLLQLRDTFAFCIPASYLLDFAASKPPEEQTERIASTTKAPLARAANQGPVAAALPAAPGGANAQTLPKTVARALDSSWRFSGLSLDQILASDEKVHDLVSRMNSAPKLYLDDAKSLLGHYRNLHFEKKLLDSEIDRGTRKGDIINAVAEIVMDHLTNAIDQAPMTKKYEAAREAAVAMIGLLFPTPSFKGGVLGEKYRRLKELVREKYLQPLAENLYQQVRVEPKLRDYEWLETAFEEAYRFTPICNDHCKNTLRMAYSGTMCMWRRINYGLKSPDLDDFRWALDKIETTVFDRQHFFSRASVRMACKSARVTSQLAIARLNDLVEKDRATWLPIQQHFMEKHNKTYFLYNWR